MTDDVRKLLGGYATGTLSEDEKKALYSAALEDDELFAALSDEEALRELLDDGSARAQLLRVAEQQRFSLRAAFAEWFGRPKAKVLVATMAVLVAAIGFDTYRRQPASRQVASEPARPAMEGKTATGVAPPPPPARLAIARPKKASRSISSGTTKLEYAVVDAGVQVTVNEAGTAALAAGTQVVAVVPVETGKTVVLPVPPQLQSVTLSFQSGLLPAAPAAAEARREKAVAASADAAAPALSVEIPLHPKKP